MISLANKTMQLVNKDKFKAQFGLQSMVIPGIIYVFIFSYIPLFGIIIAFKEYDIFLGMLNSPWVGLKHFTEFFSNPNFVLLLKNTLLISFYKLVFGFPFPIMFAVLLNELKRPFVKRFFQTVTYLPYFLSWVVVSGMVISLLAVDGGTVNTILINLGLVDRPINWLSTPGYFRTILVSTNIWKSMGYSAIIFIAAISGINPELYEACSIDGASRFRQIFAITLPSIIPQIIIVLILQVASILSAGFDDILLLTNRGENAILREVSDVFDTYVYRTGINSQRYSHATAIGLFKSVVSIFMVVAANAFAKKISDTSLW